MKTGTPEITHWSSEIHGELSEQSMTALLKSMGYRINCYIYSPGTFFPDHDHNVDKIDAVLSGRFRISMENRAYILEAGDWLEVPRGVVHSAEVLGDQSVISLDAIKND